jgi:leucyl-tRNA synthetase
MELSNDITTARASGMGATPSGKAVLAYAMEMIVRLVEPCAPYMCAELWQMMGGTDIWDATWPVTGERFLIADTELAVQVNGEARDRIVVAADAAEADILAAANELPGVAKYLEGTIARQGSRGAGETGQPGGEAERVPLVAARTLTHPPFSIL